MRVIEVSSWANWKTLLRNKLLLMQYFDTGVKYDFYLLEGLIVWHYGLLKDGGADQTDFDSNYKNLRYDQERFYSASIVGLGVAASPTDIFTLTGSASRLVLLKRLLITGTRTTAGVSDLIFLKRSTADTGGTSTTPTVVPHDSNAGVGSAVVNVYTANPTLGALVGNLLATKIYLGGTTGTTVPFQIDISTMTPCVLAGVTEVFAINLNGVTVAGNNFDITLCWSEI